MIEQLAGLAYIAMVVSRLVGHHGRAPAQDGVTVRGQLGRQLRVPRASGCTGRRRWSRCRRSSRARRACACSARGTRSRRSPTPTSWSRSTACRRTWSSTARRARSSFGAALRYGDLAPVLDAEGLALHNLASLPHISVAGAVATATHGSGDRNGNLATAVAGLELVTSGGEIVTAARGDADFDGLVVGLGALGAVTRVTLDVEPAYEVRQRVFEDLAWDALFEHFDAIMALGYSVSVFTVWGDSAHQVWVKSRGADPVRPDLFGARPATADLHVIPGHRPGQLHAAARPARPVVGPPAALPDGLHAEQRRRDPVRVPGAARPRGGGDRGRARRSATAIRPLLQVTEIRTVAADRLWMSPQYGRDTVGIHFTWKRGAGRRRAGARRHRGRARAVRRAPALGQAVRGPTGAALRAPAGLRAPGRAARPARRVPQRLARTSTCWDHHGMTAVANLAHAYHQRRAEFVSEERFGDWRLKLYGLAAPDKGVRQELLDTTRRLAEESLPRGRRHAPRGGVRDRPRRDATRSRSSTGGSPRTSCTSA